uniref:Proton-coupled amino acid transporter 4 n=1 Tax=Cacopsylla melanoneura TaxID=428564 RepID=A0A8D9FA52_9HEMI
MDSHPPGHIAEMETFLPQDGSKQKDSTNIGSYKVAIVPSKIRDEAVQLNQLDWDPFKERKLAHPVTDGETLTHLLKAALGSGILSMPFAFKNSGLTAGIFLTILVSFICTHCAYIIVQCAHVLYRKTRVTAMSLPEIGEVAFAKGPVWGRKYAKSARTLIQVALFLAYFGSCSVYCVIIAKNFSQVISYHTGTNWDIRIYISAFLIPMILLCWTPNLKSLAPVSMFANLCMGLGLGITFYYIVWDLHKPSELPQLAPVENIPIFLSITIFAIEAIGVVMPLENNMATPRHFVGLCGVLNQGMGGVTLVYIFLGFIGYLKYGEETQDNITYNLPQEEFAPQVANISIGMAVFCTFALQFFVAKEIVWNGLKDNFPKRPVFYEYVVRTIIVIAAVGLAVAVPTIGPFLGLIGALCFSFLGLIIPVFIEVVTYWEGGFGAYNWRIFKNILVLIFGILALVFGTQTSITDIIKAYSPAEPIVTPLLNATLVDTLVANATSLAEKVANSTFAATAQ